MNQTNNLVVEQPQLSTQKYPTKMANSAPNLQIDSPVNLSIKKNPSQTVQSQTQIEQTSPHNNHARLHQVDENDFMPPISLWTKLGGLLLVGSVGIAIALAALTPYKVSIKADSKIRPDGKVKLIQAETAGTIVTVQAQENQPISKGDIIATIDNSNLETEVNLLQNQVQQGNLQIQQLAAQTAAINR